VQAAFQLSQDKSSFIAAQLPVRHEVLQAKADITERLTLASRKYSCNTSDEGVEEDEAPASIPAQLPTPPKQARAKGRPAGHQDDRTANSFGRPSLPFADLDGMIQDLAEEVMLIIFHLHVLPPFCRPVRKTLLGNLHIECSAVCNIALASIGWSTSVLMRRIGQCRWLLSAMTPQPPSSSMWRCCMG
jgi:hypothetical protein